MCCESKHTYTRKQVNSGQNSPELLAISGLLVSELIHMFIRLYWNNEDDYTCLRV